MASNAAKNTYNGKLARHEKEDNLRENIGMQLTRSAQSISDRTGMNSLVPAQGARKLSGVLQI